MLSQPASKPLLLHGRVRASVFDLLGRGEVDLTAALGWTLTRSPSLLAALWERLGMPGDPANVDVVLEAASDDGRTDIELIGTTAHVIIEAKIGWIVPGEIQLTSYAPRTEEAATRLLVSLSDSSVEWANRLLPDAVAGAPVRHLPWDAVRADIRTALTSARSPTERLWLTELRTYMAGATSVRDPAEQWVYNVVVSNTRFGSRSTFREWVVERRTYFHPYGAATGWPKRPVTLLAFRWGGLVRQVNRVTSWEVVPHLGDRYFDARDADGAEGAHIVYDLGPDIPIPLIPTTGTYASGRVWALLDQMLTQPTLQDAVRTSKEITNR